MSSDFFNRPFDSASMAHVVPNTLEVIDGVSIDSVRQNGGDGCGK